MVFDIVEFLKRAAASKASDVHLKTDEAPAVRIDGHIVKLDMPALSAEDMDALLDIILPEHLKASKNTVFELDFAYEIKDVSRFRINLNKQMCKSALTLRLLPIDIVPLADLKLPAVINHFTTLNNGLVLVTGATGSGKSTTIASLIDVININYPKHIVTVEDPIEFVFKSKKSIVSQRQVGRDTANFNDGIKYSLRQDPDVLFIGEIRDMETITNALKAAETGHLVFATIHTNNAVETVNRVVNMFAPSDRDFVRIQLANVLRGTISQKLVPLAGGSGRQAVCEVLVSTPAVKDYIEKDKLDEIYSLARSGSASSILTMNSSLYILYKTGIITQETAMAHSDNKNELEQMFRGVYQGSKD